jgi:hypothetical protein
VKRPILGFLAAVLLSAGLIGSVPAQAATPDPAAIVTPAHDSGGGHDHKGDHDGYKYSHPHGKGSAHRQHPRHDDGGHDHDGGHDDGHRRKRCSGLIVICLGSASTTAG